MQGKCPLQMSRAVPDVSRFMTAAVKTSRRNVQVLFKVSPTASDSIRAPSPREAGCRSACQQRLCCSAPSAAALSAGAQRYSSESRTHPQTVQLLASWPDARCERHRLDTMHTSSMQKYSHQQDACAQNQSSKIVAGEMMGCVIVIL